MSARKPLIDHLPEFPWDQIADVKERAAEYPEGLIDLSVGSPVDPVAPGVQLGLTAAGGLTGYPQTKGTAELRTEIVQALARRFGLFGLSENAVLPVIGLKEAIAWLPTLFGFQGQTVCFPRLAYPTYEVAALLAGATPQRGDCPAEFGDARLVFVNSPSNPTGAVKPVDELREIVAWARETGAIVASDECYLGLGYNDAQPPVSILDERVSGGDHTGLVALHSLSKTANLASYRAGFIAGDEDLVQELLAVRKHAGLIVPGPIQAAMVEALRDDASAQLQRHRYAARRAVLMKALIGAGFRIEQSDAGMYLWATRGQSDRDSAEWLAERGILVALGSFYGPDGAQFVRVGLNATDDKIAEAAERINEPHAAEKN